MLYHCPAHLGYVLVGEASEHCRIQAVHVAWRYLRQVDVRYYRLVLDFLEPLYVERKVCLAGPDILDYREQAKVLVGGIALCDFAVQVRKARQ